MNSADAPERWLTWEVRTTADMLRFMFLAGEMERRRALLLDDFGQKIDNGSFAQRRRAAS
jgi:hypothetical protein